MFIYNRQHTVQLVRACDWYCMFLKLGLVGNGSEEEEYLRNTTYSYMYLYVSLPAWLLESIYFD
jgi:hypothetical protein